MHYSDPQRTLVSHTFVSFTMKEFGYSLSKTKEPPKILSLSDMRGGKFVSVNNFSAQEQASSKNRQILNFRIMGCVTYNYEKYILISGFLA